MSFRSSAVGLGAGGCTRATGRSGDGRGVEGTGADRGASPPDIDGAEPPWDAAAGVTCGTEGAGGLGADVEVGPEVRGAGIDAGAGAAGADVGAATPGVAPDTGRASGPEG